MRRAVWLALGLTLLAVPSWAQTPTTNPTRAEFIVSSDHNVVVLGVPRVDHYDLEIVVSSNGALFLTVGMGKPPAVDGAQVTVPISQFASLPRDIIHYAVAIAVGPGGTGRSGPSNPFVVPGEAPAPGPPSGLVVR